MKSFYFITVSHSTVHNVLRRCATLRGNITPVLLALQTDEDLVEPSDAFVKEVTDQTDQIADYLTMPHYVTFRTPGNVEVTLQYKCGVFLVAIEFNRNSSVLAAEMVGSLWVEEREAMVRVDYGNLISVSRVLKSLL